MKKIKFQRTMQVTDLLKVSKSRFHLYKVFFDGRRRVFFILLPKNPHSSVVRISNAENACSFNHLNTTSFCGGNPSGLLFGLHQ